MKNKNFQKILKFLPLVFLASLIPLHFANAFVVEFIGLSLVGGVLGFILFAAGFIGSLLVTLGGGLTTWALNLNSTVLTSSTVEVGWVIVRDLANLGFVLAIIVIAFTTILRFGEYETKKLLGRLIIAALLVNFSLIIAGVFIDFSGTLTNFFIEEATGGNFYSLQSSLANAFKVQAIFKPSDDASQMQKIFSGIANGATSGLFNFLASMFFVVIFTFAAAFTLLGLAFLLFIRYIALTILLILMPLAWLFYILPSFQNLWSQWWGKFFQWVWFAPAASFFIYLALAIPRGTAQINEIKSFVDSAGALQKNVAIADFAGVIGQMIAVIGILVGGLIVANQMGIHGASAVMQTGKGLKNWAVGFSGRWAGARAMQALQLGAQEGKGNIIQRTSTRFAGTPVIGGVARAVNTWANTASQKQIEDHVKELSGLDRAAFVSAGHSRSRMFLDPTYAAAYAKTAATKGYLPELKKEENKIILESVVPQARKMGIEGTLLSKDPTLAKIGESDLAKARAKIKSAQNKKQASTIVSDYDAETLRSPDITSLFTETQVEYILKNASAAQINSIKAGIEELNSAIAESEGVAPKEFAELEPHLKNMYKDAEGWKVAVAKQSEDYKSLSEELKLEYKRDADNLKTWLNNNPGSQSGETPKRNKRGKKRSEEAPPVVASPKYGFVR